MKTLTLTFQISDEAYNLLFEIEKAKAAEYRDPEYATLEDFKTSFEYKNGLKTEESFLNRNFGGTYHLIHELMRHDLVDLLVDAWHQAYFVSPLGKQLIKQ